MSLLNGSKLQKTYNAADDLEYTEYLLTEILMICGYNSFDLNNYTIDEVVLKLRDIFSTTKSLQDMASNSYISILSSLLVSNYRRYWFNRQLINGAINNG